MQIVEILDDRDRPVPDGEVGQVVVTQLSCLAQPLLRYRLGDLAARIPGYLRLRPWARPALAGYRAGPAT